MKKRRLIIFILSFIVVLAAFCIFSPLPAIWFFKISFNINLYSIPQNYESLKNNLTFKSNIDYNSAYLNGKFDIILPQPSKNNYKLIFWIHGGGFISGDKSMVEHYMVLLADKGFNIVNMNYALSPKNRYPIALKQIEEAYVYIQENAADYGISVENIYFGGDSAGAQLAAQFVNIQTNSEYAAKVNDAIKGKGIAINSIIDKNNISGLLLFCGVYNIKELLNPPKNTMLLPFKKIGWAYFGIDDINDKNIELCDIVKFIDENYPPVFITDGNTLSFENQAKEFENTLKAKSIYVKSVFYPKEEAILKHEYQFYMDTKYAKKTFEEVIKFLSIETRMLRS
ncbi:MAG: alpha/beta hydrolase [Endomicrobium sp.]|jgi:acetyl esterase/lipase|nr:alpha/beta hydrolase [Endomicrobium sp.]